MSHAGQLLCRGAKPRLCEMTPRQRPFRKDRTVGTLSARSLSLDRSPNTIIKNLPSASRPLAQARMRTSVRFPNSGLLARRPCGKPQSSGRRHAPGCPKSLIRTDRPQRHSAHRPRGPKAWASLAARLAEVPLPPLGPARVAVFLCDQKFGPFDERAPVGRCRAADSTYGQWPATSRQSTATDPTGLPTTRSAPGSREPRSSGPKSSRRAASALRVAGAVRCRRSWRSPAIRLPVRGDWKQRNGSAVRSGGSALSHSTA